MSPSSPSKVLLATDIDGTLLGDAQGEVAFTGFTKANRENIHLVFMTARTRDSVAALVAESRLPAPDFLFSSVGTELCSWNGWRSDAGQRFATLVPPRWDLAGIYARGVGDGVTRQTFVDHQPPFHAGFHW